jgi:hypothetical protein
LLDKIIYLGHLMVNVILYITETALKASVLLTDRLLSIFDSVAELGNIALDAGNSFLEAVWRGSGAPTQLTKRHGKRKPGSRADDQRSRCRFVPDAPDDDCKQRGSQHQIDAGHDDRRAVRRRHPCFPLSMTLRVGSAPNQPGVIGLPAISQKVKLRTEFRSTI